MKFDMTNIVEPQWVEEGDVMSKPLIFPIIEVRYPDFIEFLQKRESKFEIFTRKISKLYQNVKKKYIGKDTMVYLAKLWQEWESYYNTVKTTILGEK